MIIGQSLSIKDLSAEQIKALKGRRIVAAKGKSDDSEWPVLGIGTVLGDKSDSTDIIMYVDFGDDDIIGVFADEHIVVLDIQQTN